MMKHRIFLCVLAGLGLSAFTLPAPDPAAAPVFFRQAAAGGTETICGFKGGNPTHGAEIYAKTCVSCHGADGKGAIPGTPDFTKKGGVLSHPHTALEDHIKNGFQSPGSPMPMPARGGNTALSDRDIRDVHAYLHKAFGCG